MIFRKQNGLLVWTLARHKEFLAIPNCKKVSVKATIIQLDIYPGQAFLAIEMRFQLRYS